MLRLCELKVCQEEHVKFVRILYFKSVYIILCFLYLLLRVELGSFEDVDRLG